MSIIVGIDPGVSGGLAFIDTQETTDPWATYRMPIRKVKDGTHTRSEMDGHKLVHLFKAHGDLSRSVVGIIDLAVIECVHAMPKQGVVSVFSFGKGYGKILGVLEALGIPIENPKPPQWKKVILSGSGKRDKAAAINFCRMRFPTADLCCGGQKYHDGIADAVCLAEFGRRLLQGK